MQMDRTALNEVIAAYARKRKLSPRQAEIIHQHVRGRADKEVAASFGCTEATVYEHWRRMAQKCGLHLKSEVIADFHAFVWNGAAETSPSLAAG
jgi:DNA-binding CsgD family transcriptional regulator